MARLDMSNPARDHSVVICGASGCRARLAIVMSGPVSNTDPNYPWYIRFENGWAPKHEAGVLIWKTTTHAERKLDRGYSPSDRRVPQVPVPAGKVFDYYAQGPTQLPVRVECPTCGAVRILDPDILRVCRHAIGFGPGEPGEDADYVQWAAFRDA